jgi:hypothetical protein
MSPRAKGVLDSVREFLDSESHRLRGDRCAECRGKVKYCVATFWLYGDDASWDIPLTMCPSCAKRATEIESDIDMDQTHATSIHAQGWKEVYKAALFEADKSKRLSRITEAETALALRARELFHTHDKVERQAVDTAMRSLRTLRLFENHG